MNKKYKQLVTITAFMHLSFASKTTIQAVDHKVKTLQTIDTSLEIQNADNIFWGPSDIFATTKDKEIAIYKPHRKIINKITFPRELGTVRFSPDWKLIAVKYKNTTQIIIFNLFVISSSYKINSYKNTKKVILKKMLCTINTNKHIEDFCFYPNEKKILILERNKLSIYNILGQLSKSKTLNRYYNKIICNSNENCIFLINKYSNSLGKYNIKKETLKINAAGFIKDIKYIPGKNILATIDDKGAMLLYYAEKQQPHTKISFYGAKISNLEVSPDKTNWLIGKTIIPKRICCHVVIPEEMHPKKRAEIIILHTKNFLPNKNNIFRSQKPFKISSKCSLKEAKYSKNGKYISCMLSDKTVKIYRNPYFKRKPYNIMKKTRSHQSEKHTKKPRFWNVIIKCNN